MIHVDVQQKPTKHCKATILQLKRNFKPKKKKANIELIKNLNDQLKQNILRHTPSQMH